MPTDSPATPPSVLKQAINAVPAVKYALGVGGIISVIAIVRGFGIDYRVALLGAVVMLVLMTVLLVFAKASSRPQSTFKAPAFIFTWFSLVLFMATATALILSVFFGKPLDLRTLLAPVTLRGTHLNKKSPLKVTLSEPETTQQKIGTFKFSSPKEGWLPQWGQTAGDLVYAVTPGMDLGPARGQYRFMLVVRIEDPTIERNQDTSIVKSAAYEIKNEATTLAVRVDQEFMRRLHGASMVSVSLVMMPTAVEPTQIHKLADVGPHGGAILATNMFLFQTVTLVITNPNVSPNTTGNQPK